MKRFRPALLAIVLGLVSCTDKAINLPTYSNELYAQIEHLWDVEQTKTSKDDNNNIRWSEADQVIAFMKTSLGARYEIDDNSVGKTSGSFSRITDESSNDLLGGMELNHNVVYYPYASDVECERMGTNYALDVVLPIEQVYAVNSFGDDAFPMVAISDDNNLTFKNVCGGIKLQFKGSQKVSSIKIEGKNNEILSGDAVITVYTDETKPSIEMSNNSSTSVMLNCGEGVQLSEDKSTKFIITTPPISFSKGFTVTVTDVDGQTYLIETDKCNEIFRSTLLVMPEVTLEEDQMGNIPDVPEGVLRIFADKTEIKADGTDEVTFTIMFGSENVSKAKTVQLIREIEGNEKRLPYGKNTFTTTRPGSYKFTAHYYYEGEHYSENSVSVEAKQVEYGEEKQFLHKLLGFHFTMRYFTPCIDTEATIKELQEKYPNRISIVSFYPAMSGSPDAFTLPETSEYMYFFNTEGVPSFYWSMRKTMYYHNQIEDAYWEERDNYIPNSGVAIQTTYNASSAELEISIGITSNTSTNYRYMIFLVEDGISDENGYIYNNVVRDILTRTIVGDKINDNDPLIVGVETTAMTTTTLSNEWIASNMRVVVASLISLDDGYSWTIDNVNECKVGESVSYLYE